MPWCRCQRSGAGHAAQAAAGRPQDAGAGARPRGGAGGEPSAGVREVRVPVATALHCKPRTPTHDPPEPAGTLHEKLPMKPGAVIHAAL